MKPKHVPSLRSIAAVLAMGLSACFAEAPTDSDLASERADIQAADSEDADIDSVSFAATGTPSTHCTRPLGACTKCSVVKGDRQNYTVWLPTGAVGPVYLEDGTMRRKVWPSTLPTRTVNGIIQVDTQANPATLSSLRLTGVITTGDCESNIWSPAIDQY